MSPERPGWYARRTSSMYSAPRSVAAASWTFPASGRVSLAATRPRAVPPMTQARPPRPVHSKNRRRDGSWSSPRYPRPAAQRIRSSPTIHTTNPAAMPLTRLPSRTTTAATSPPSAAKATRERGNRRGATDSHAARRQPEGRRYRGCVPVSASGSLAREVEERHRDDGRGDLAPFALDAVFHRDPRAGLRMRLVEGAEADHLLDRRPPCDRRRASDLPPLAVDGHGRTVDERRDHRGEAVLREHLLDPGPV